MIWALIQVFAPTVVVGVVFLFVRIRSDGRHNKKMAEYDRGAEVFNAEHVRRLKMIRAKVIADMERPK